MNSLLTRSQRAELIRALKLIAVRILALPWAMVIAWAVLLGLLASLAGLPGAELAWGLVLETAEPVVVFQAKMLAAVCSIGGLCLFLGAYRFKALFFVVADWLKTRASKLVSLWFLTFIDVGPLISLPTAPVARVPAEALTAGPRAGFVAGDTPQLE